MKNKKSIFGAVLGNGLEYYDVNLFGFFAIILSPLFFPTEDPYVARMMSFFAFAAAYVMRPFGALVFGYFGDKYGRRNSLLFSILLLTIPTFIIGVLPTYETIGFWAPLILIICRFSQGVCMGGEYGGAATYITEQAVDRPVFAGSLLNATGFLGAIVGTFLGAILMSSFMPSWAWRLTFILGGVLGIAIYFIRGNMTETNSFKKIEKQKKVSRMPILDVLKFHKRSAFCVVGTSIHACTPFYLATVYLNGLLIDTFHVASSNILWINTGIMSLWAILIPFFGRLGDHVGGRRMMKLACIGGMLVAYPAYLLIDGTTNISHVIIFQMIITLITVPYFAGYSSTVPLFFPVTSRYTGFGFSEALGMATLGAATPLIATYIVHATNSMMPLSYYLIASAILGWSCIKFAPEYSRDQEGDNDFCSSSSVNIVASKSRISKTA